jgi:asparagine synthase (glutamine-hydrolysing)
MTFNGEIYNFLELREGLALRSDTDSEVLLERFCENEKLCWHDFNGMWAVGVWDTEDRRLTLCRDRFGVKPLYYYNDGKTFAFASEIKGLLGLVDLETDIPGLKLNISIGTDASEITPWKHVKQLLAGHRLTLEADGFMRLHRYWQPLKNMPAIQPFYVERRERLLHLLNRACALRLRSDVPVATALSGGLDSASVYATVRGVGDLARRRPETWTSAYVCVTEGMAREEQDRAIQWQGESGSLVVVSVSIKEAIERFDDVLYSAAEFGKLYLSQWFLYRAMSRDGIKVSIDGHGADESLAGYLAPILSRARADALERASMFRGDGLEKPDPQPWYEEKQISPTWNADKDGLAGCDRVQRLLYEQTYGQVLCNILRTFDRASMAHGVEVRMPFLDKDLAPFALALPSADKIANGRTKWILRDAMEGKVPDYIRLAKVKYGFETPIRKWRRGPLQELVRETEAEPDFADFKRDFWPSENLRANNEWYPIQGYRLIKRFRQERKNVLRAVR